MERKSLWIFLLVGACLAGWLWCQTPVAVLAQDEEVTVSKAQKEARILKFQVDRLKNLLTILGTYVNQINNLVVRIRSVLGEVNGPAAAARSQGQVRIALQNLLRVFDVMGCTLPRPSEELICRFKNEEEENIGVLEVVRSAIHDPENSISSHIGTLREMVDELKLNGDISAGATSKIKAQLIKMELDLEGIDETLDEIETILGSDPEEGIQRFLRIIQTKIDKAEEVTFAEIVEARENASRAVGISRDPETGAPTFLRKALAGTRRFSPLARKLIIDFTPITSQLRVSRRSSPFFASFASPSGVKGTMEVAALFDLAGKRVTDPAGLKRTRQALGKRQNARERDIGKIDRVYIAVVVARDERGQIRAYRVQKILIKI